MRIIKVKTCSDCPYMEINFTAFGREILGDYCNHINQYIQDVDIHKKYLRIVHWRRNERHNKNPEKILA